MAIQLMDNFQFYGDDANRLLETWWSDLYVANTLSDIVDDPDTNADADSKAFKFSMDGIGSAVCRLAIPTPGQQMGVACRFWMSSLPQSNNHGPGIQFNTSGNGPMYFVHIGPSGAISLIRRDKSGWTESGDTIVETTSGPVVGAGAWYHIEFYMDTATGDYEVRVEGVTVLDGNDASHHTDNMAIFALVEHWDCTANDTRLEYIKDLVIWDDTGTQNNSFIGPVTVYSLQVDGDVSSTSATPSTGTDIYATMDELSVSDVDYTSLGVVPSEMVMTFEDVPADVVAIRAAQMLVRSQKTDGGDAVLQLGLVSGASEDTGALHAIGTSFTWEYDVSELDPNTSVTWTPAGLNAASLRVNRTT